MMRAAPPVVAEESFPLALGSCCAPATSVVCCGVATRPQPSSTKQAAQLGVRLVIRVRPKTQTGFELNGPDLSEGSSTRV
jgi:hypothetical protein